MNGHLGIAGVLGSLSREWGITESSFTLVDEDTVTQRGEQDGYKYEERYQGGST